MNSEKVKEIKAQLEENISLCTRVLLKGLLEDCLTLINELESDNKTLLKSKTMWKRLHTELCKENQELKDRIAELENIGLNEDMTIGEYLREMQMLKDRVAELEKENAIKTDTIVDLLKKQELYEKEKLTKFAERLKEKYRIWETDKQIIDETLKEFME